MRPKSEIIMYSFDIYQMSETDLPILSRTNSQRSVTLCTDEQSTCNEQIETTEIDMSHLREYVEKKLLSYFSQIFSVANAHPFTKECAAALQHDFRGNLIDIEAFTNEHYARIDEWDAMLDTISRRSEEESRAFYSDKLERDIAETTVKNAAINAQIDVYKTIFVEFANWIVDEENTDYLAFQRHVKDCIVQEVRELQVQTPTVKTIARLNDFKNRDQAAYQDMIFVEKRNFAKFVQAAERWNRIITTAIKDFYGPTITYYPRIRPTPK